MNGFKLRLTSVGMNAIDPELPFANPTWWHMAWFILMLTCWSGLAVTALFCRSVLDSFCICNTIYILYLIFIQYLLHVITVTYLNRICCVVVSMLIRRCF